VRPASAGPRPIRWIGALASRYPRIVDAGIAALVALLGLPAVDSADSGVAGGLWYAALHLPLIWRRRAPTLVFWAVCALVTVGIVADLARVDRGLFPEAVVMVALYAVARHRTGRHLWWAAGTIEAVMAVLLLLTGPRWGVLALATSVPAATVLLGVTIRTRRAYLAELEERAHRLERERDQQARLAVAAERARIAREVHDIVAHNVAVMVALADGAALTVTAAPQRAADTMLKVSATGREALGEMRRLLGLLRDGPAPDGPSSDGGPAPGGPSSGGPAPAGPSSGGPSSGGPAPDPGPAGPARTPQPGFADLDRLVDQVRAAGLPVAVTRDGVPGAWGPGAGLTVYRIVQEALTNTLKHAGPDASAHISLRYTADGVDLEVADTGTGPAAGTSHGGHGLAGMAERAASYGGQVQAGPRTGGTGWRVRTRLRFADLADDGAAL
jgi:signal transduction histidine kinase